MPRLDAASISRTSSEVPAEISRQESQVPSGSSGGTVRAVQRLCQNARGGGLANAAHARENVSVRDAIRLDRVRERPRDVLLPDDFRERLRADIFGR